MGYQSALALKSETTDTDTGVNVLCDQAIFTSVRSPTGEGYRLIAASPGLRSEEQAEIIRRSPSHGGLCDTGPEAVGLSSYVLSSGRHCVAYCCYAGREHTARGGQRVYTYMAVLDRASYRYFNSDPVPIHSALAEILVKEGPTLKPSQRLEPLTLCIPPSTYTNEQYQKSSQTLTTSMEWIWPIAADILAGRHVIFIGARQPFLLLEWILLSIPLHIRESVDASVGLKFSPSRRMQLVILDHDEGDVQRLIAGQDISFWHANSPPGPPAPSLKSWFKLLQRWYHQGRFAPLVRLTSQVCADAPANALPRIAAICEDIDRLSKADNALLETMVRRYEQVVAETSAEEKLIEQIIGMAQ